MLFFIPESPALLKIKAPYIIIFWITLQKRVYRLKMRLKKKISNSLKVFFEVFEGLLGNANSSTEKFKIQGWGQKKKTDRHFF